jgi:hypothetical protein
MHRREIIKGLLIAAFGGLPASTIFAGELNLEKLGITSVKSGDDPKVVTFGKNAFLLSKNSEIEIEAESTSLALKSIRLISGAVQGVFDPDEESERQLLTPDAIIGIRGTGLYARYEPEDERTYLCLCYGKLHIESKQSRKSELLTTNYHKARIIDKSGVHYAWFVDMDHNDDDLMMLEESVGRKPHWDLPSSGMKYRKS